MAVSFKVPASPKRNIFEIDQFLGVDLTNTGSNIEEIRSPNAENMVRYVPGKVRKRTGYHTKIEFSPDADVNRAKNTSDDYFNCVFDEDDSITYDIYEANIPVFSIFMTVELIGTYRFVMNYSDYTATNTDFSNTGDEPRVSNIVVFKTDKTSNGGLRNVQLVKLSDGEYDYIKVKSMRICKDTSATTMDEWKNIAWKAAPEDKGIAHVTSEANQTVYGCHVLKNGTFEGNRVVNVNRALSTSSQWVDYSVSDDADTDLYQFGEQFYINGDQSERAYVNVEFDYVSDGEVKLVLGGWYFTNPIIKDTHGNIVHCSFKEAVGSFTSHKCWLRAVEGTASVRIKNFSVMYDINESYSWSPAPEDNTNDFHIEDLYDVASKSKALIDSYNETITHAGTNVGTITATIADSTSNVTGFSKVSFDLYTSTSQRISSITVEVKNDSNASLYKGTKTFNKNLSSEHIEFYVSAGSSTNYVKYIAVSAVVQTTGSTDFTARLSNVKVQEIKIRESFDISSKNYIYHVGRHLYFRPANGKTTTEIYSDANQHLSKSWQLNERIFILDGKRIYSYMVGDSTVEILTEGTGYIPLVTIAKSPVLPGDTGASDGQSYEALNMLQPGFYEQFTVDTAHAESTAFQLSFRDLDDTPTKAWLLDSAGNWQLKTEGTDYSVDRATGLVTFTTAPGVTPITGEDNVKILAYRTVKGYADRVAKCTFGTLFGVGGASDRLFLGGNPDHPNWDFYSQQFDPTYFPDTGYTALGTSASAIVGYAIINNYLATFKDEYDNSQVVFIREGDLVVDSEKNTSEPSFKIINTLQGNGVIAPYAIGYLQTEPIFLTRSGLYAITAQDITGEKYTQNRSFYLNGALTKEPNLENAVSTVFDDQYILAINNKLYILDGLQPTRTDRSEPYATRQYAGFYCTNVPAVSIWSDNQALWIGTSDGKVCRFATDIEDLESYNDNGKEIYCCWETPDLDGNLFYKNKTFRYFAIRMMQALRTSVKMYTKKLGTWNFVKEDVASGVTFDFAHIDFEMFSFSLDTSEKVAHTKIRVKKVDKARFRVENGKLNEPFGLFDFALEYIESGNYKG